MNILEIYKKYKIPPNLQEHMLRVTSVGVYLVDHWKNKSEVDREIVIESLLLHDMGNIIKFNLDQPLFLKKDKIPYWKEVKKEFIEKYNGDEHVATEAIAQELEAPVVVQDILKKKGVSSTHDAMATDDWNKKIFGYADLRIDPYGVVTVNKRFDDVNVRYKDSEHHLGDVKGVEERRQWALKLEEQIQSHVTVDLQSITNELIRPYLEEVSSFNI